MTDDTMIRRPPDDALPRRGYLSSIIVVCHLEYLALLLTVCRPLRSECEIFWLDVC
jgi:hypothetical protein